MGEHVAVSGPVRTACPAQSGPPGASVGAAGGGAEEGPWADARREWGGPGTLCHRGL